MAGSDPAFTPPRLPRPWWREPFMLGFFSLIVIACVAILSQGKFKAVDPSKPAELPRGGTFCDTPTPVQSTAVNPSTQFPKQTPRLP